MDGFSIPLSDIDAELPMSPNGVDSLVELNCATGSAVQSRPRCRFFEILQSASLNEFASLVVTKSEMV